MYLYLPLSTILAAGTGFSLIHHVGLLVLRLFDDDDDRKCGGQGWRGGGGRIQKERMGENVVMNNTGENMAMDLNK